MVPWDYDDRDCDTAGNTTIRMTVADLAKLTTGTLIVVGDETYCVEKISYSNFSMLVSRFNKEIKDMRKLISSKRLLAAFLDEKRPPPFMRRQQLPGFVVKRPKWDSRCAPNLSGRRDPRKEIMI